MSVLTQWWCNVKPIFISRAKVWNSSYATSQVEVRILLSCFLFNSIRASLQLLVSFLPSTWNPHVTHGHLAPLTSWASHICALLPVPPLLIRAPCSMRYHLHERLDNLHLKLREALCWFPPHSVELPRLIFQDLQKCPPLLILYVCNIGNFRRSLRTSYPQFRCTFAQDVLVRQKLKLNLQTLVGLNIYTTLLQN